MRVLEAYKTYGDDISYNIPNNLINKPEESDVLSLKRFIKDFDYEDISGRYPYTVGCSSSSYVDHHVAEFSGVSPIGMDRVTECPRRIQVYKMSMKTGEIYWQMGMLNIPIPVTNHDRLRYQGGIVECAKKVGINMGSFEGMIILEELQVTRPHNHVEQNIFRTYVQTSRTTDTGDYPPLPGEAMRITNNFVCSTGLDNNLGMQTNRRPVSFIQITHFIPKELLGDTPKFVPSVGLVVGRGRPLENMVHPFSYMHKVLKDAEWGDQKENLIEIRYKSNKHKKLYLPMCIDGSGDDEIVEINSIPHPDPKADDDVIEVRSSTSHKGDKWTTFLLHEDIKVGNTPINGRMTLGSLRIFDDKLMALNYQRFVNQKRIDKMTVEATLRDEMAKKEEEYKRKVSLLEQEIKVKNGEIRLKENELRHKDLEIKQVASSKVFESVRELLKVHAIKLNEKRLDKELDVKLKLAQQKTESDILTAGVRASADISVLNRRMDYEKQKHVQDMSHSAQKHVQDMAHTAQKHNQSMDLEYRKHELNSFKEQYLHQIKMQEDAIKMKREAMQLEADRRAARTKGASCILDFASKAMTTIPKLL